MTDCVPGIGLVHDEYRKSMTSRTLGLYICNITVPCIKDQSSARNALYSGERDFRALAAATEGQLEHNMLILIISAVLHVASLIYHDIQIKISK